MKTLKEFFKNYSSNPELHRKAWRQGAVKFREMKQHPEDYFTACSGLIVGMIYYSDTVKFAKRNHLLILKALFEFEEQCGVIKNKPDPREETQYFNWLAWFAWEDLAGELISYLGD